MRVINATRGNRSAQSGLSMVEILVTLTIVAFGLLGLLGLQARALTFQKDSFNRKAAAEMVGQLAERMRSNHLGFTAGNYNLNFNAAAADPASITECATITACTLPEVATRDLEQWTAELRRRVPAAAAYVRFPPGENRMVEVSIAWPEPTQAGAIASTLDDNTVCAALNATFGAGLQPFYRCYQTFIFP